MSSARPRWAPNAISPHTVLKSHVTKLLDGITFPDKLANDLSVANLIAGAIRTKVLTTPNLDQYQKASMLVNEILKSLSVYNERETLVKFCDVLKKQGDPDLNRTANTMLKEIGIDVNEDQALNFQPSANYKDTKSKVLVFFKSGVVIIVIAAFFFCGWKFLYQDPQISRNLYDVIRIVLTGGVEELRSTFGNKSPMKPNAGNSFHGQSTKIDGGLIPKHEDLLIHLKAVSEVRLFCHYLGLPPEDCDAIKTENQGNLGEQKFALIKKWREKKTRTWKEFIRAFALLDICVKAKKLATEHSVTFDPKLENDQAVLDSCEDINDRDK